jgi:hypothetical protein
MDERDPALLAEVRVMRKTANEREKQSVQLEEAIQLLNGEA